MTEGCGGSGWITLYQNADGTSASARCPGCDDCQDGE